MSSLNLLSFICILFICHPLLLPLGCSWLTQPLLGKKPVIWNLARCTDWAPKPLSSFQEAANLSLVCISGEYQWECGPKCSWGRYWEHIIYFCNKIIRKNIQTLYLDLGSYGNFPRLKILY